MRLLLTAGPTREAIDPVRYITNRSSGKMGHALAEAAVSKGHEVILISGPVALAPPAGLAEFVAVESAREMFEAVRDRIGKCDAAIFCAAVADYRPRRIAERKIKKTGDNETLSLDLVRNPDIAATLGATKRKGQILVGFALETTNELAYARKKLEAKKFDMIVLNSLRDPGAGFAGDTNKISLVYPSGEPVTFDLKSKADVAKDIVNALAALL